MADDSVTNAIAALKEVVDAGYRLSPEDATLLRSFLPAEELPDELVIPLRKPVKAGKGDQAMTYTDLALREPTAAEMLLWDNLKGREAEIMALHVVSGLPKVAIEQIGARDFQAGTRYLERFFA